MSFNVYPLNYKYEGDRDNLKKNFNIQTPHQYQKQLSLRWPLGVVHYYVDISSYDFLIVQRIRATMNTIEASSCVQFSPHLVKPTSGNDSWLHITNPDKQRECVHEPWYKEHGEVRMVLGYDCLKNVDVLHGLLHGIGFMDEVTHPHRDKYVRVLWNNIQPAYRHLFTIREGSYSELEYDPLSVMHFNDRDFTMNGHATIEPAISGLLISPSDSLSQLDKLRLRLIFGHACNNRQVVNLMRTCQNTLYKNAVASAQDRDMVKDESNKTETYNQEISDDISTDIDTNEDLNQKVAEKDKIDSGSNEQDPANSEDIPDKEKAEEDKQGSVSVENKKSNEKLDEQTLDTDNNISKVGRNRPPKVSVKRNILRPHTHSYGKQYSHNKNVEKIKKTVAKRLMKNSLVKNSVAG